eukprot:Skav216709  [mRNA]  locus=scaffold91:606644:608690:- [translate_table: standard]
MQSQLQSASRGVPWQTEQKYSDDEVHVHGKTPRTELKKLIRKELRISTAVISDTDVENLAAALDGDRTGRNISVEELLSFVERGSATFFSSSLSLKDKEPMPHAAAQHYYVLFGS